MIKLILYGGIEHNDSVLISCVNPCVIYVSTNRGESEKKRENLTHGHKKGLVKQIFTRPLSARDETDIELFLTLADLFDE